MIYSQLMYEEVISENRLCSLCCHSILLLMNYMMASGNHRSYHAERRLSCLNYQIVPFQSQNLLWKLSLSELINLPWYVWDYLVSLYSFIYVFIYSPYISCWLSPSLPSHSIILIPFLYPHFLWADAPQQVCLYPGTSSLSEARSFLSHWSQTRQPS